MRMRESVCECEREKQAAHTPSADVCASCCSAMRDDYNRSSRLVLYGDGWLVRWLLGCAHAEERNKRQRDSGPYLQRQ
jgi:hypothetical protein